MTLPLTDKQEKLWKFIASCDHSPTYAEMCAAVGTKSAGSMAVMVERLEERGLIERRPRKWRSVVALEKPRKKPNLDAFEDAELIAELERRTKDALARAAAITPVRAPNPQRRYFDWRDEAREGSAMLLARLEATGLVPA